MKIYNTLSNSIEEFIPINEGIVNMYVCGPTVNKRTHLGHMYPVIFFDMVVRYFKYLGYKVTYASNFTDVDDKIIETSIEEGIPEMEVAKRYEELYLSDLKKLNCNDVDIRPKVTEYMDDIIDMIKQLLDKGYAYKQGDDVYLDVSKVNDYGCLSNQKLTELDYGNRINVNENKLHPYDFVLWKKTDKGIKWNSPFGEGRPGWHSECVVMINKIFKNKIDIHGGGIDLKFPHHENEIAQSIVLWDNKLANYWMHNGHLMMDGIKMSKSLGNVLIVDDLLKNYTPNTIRITMLKNHYRLPLNLSDNLFDESKTIDQKIENTLKNANLYIKLNNIKTNIITKDEKLESYLNDDFNTSNLITYLLELLKDINTSTRNKQNNAGELFDRILIITNILGLKYNLPELNDEELKLYKNWQDARNNNNFELADQLRNELTKLNII